MRHLKTLLALVLASRSDRSRPSPPKARRRGRSVRLRFMVFVMAIFVGYYVVWSVTPALHTPLMSVTNAISSVIVVGALLAVGVALTDSPTASLPRSSASWR